MSWKEIRLFQNQHQVCKWQSREKQFLLCISWTGFQLNCLGFFNFTCWGINNLSTSLHAFWSIEKYKVEQHMVLKTVFSIEVFIYLSCGKKINNILCVPKPLCWVFPEISLCRGLKEALLLKTFLFSCTGMCICSNKEMRICWKDSGDRLLQLSCLPTAFHLALNSLLNPRAK